MSFSRKQLLILVALTALAFALAVIDLVLSLMLLLALLVLVAFTLTINRSKGLHSSRELNVSLGLIALVMGATALGYVARDSLLQIRI